MKRKTPRSLLQRLTGNEVKVIDLCRPVIDWMDENKVHTLTIKRSGKKVTLDFDARSGGEAGE